MMKSPRSCGRPQPLQNSAMMFPQPQMRTPRHCQRVMLPTMKLDLTLGPVPGSRGIERLSQDLEGWDTLCTNPRYIGRYWPCSAGTFRVRTSSMYVLDSILIASRPDSKDVWNQQRELFLGSVTESQRRPYSVSPCLRQLESRPPTLDSRLHLLGLFILV
jgi:hypothetical protein